MTIARKWMVTGGCGFAGSNLADALLSDGIDVVVVDNFSRVGAKRNLQWLRERHGEQWRFAQVDMREPDAVANLIREVRPLAVAHLAGQVAMTTSVADPRLDFQINAMGTFNLIDAIRLHSPDTIVVYSSSNKVYGTLAELNYREEATRYTLPDFPQGLPESLQLDGQSPYGCSKLAAEQYVRDFHRTYGLRSVVFRHSSIYGGRQFATFDQGWVGWFMQEIMRQKDQKLAKLSICGNGKQVRDLLHAQDLVSLYRKTAQAIDRAAGMIFNIGGGAANSISLLELIDWIAQRARCDVNIDKGPFRLGDQKVFIADVALAQRTIGWSPQVSREQGLNAMLDWTRELIHGG